MVHYFQQRGITTLVAPNFCPPPRPSFKSQVLSNPSQRLCIGTSYWWSLPTSAMPSHSHHHHHDDVGHVIIRRRRTSFHHLQLYLASYRLTGVHGNRTGRMIPSQVERMPMLPTMSHHGVIISRPLLTTNQECRWAIRIVTQWWRIIICHSVRYLQQSRNMTLCRRPKEEDHHRQ